MKHKGRPILGTLLVLVAFGACKKEPDQEPSSGSAKVNFDLNEVPYSTLSAYGFYEGKLHHLRPVPEVLPYEPTSSLFTDHAKKQRFIWMPEAVRGNYVSDHTVLSMPESTVLLKNFYYDNTPPNGGRRIIETRMLFKRDGQWEFANYVWNNEQTEAYLDLVGSNIPISWTNESGNVQNIQYRIPSLVECQSCHRNAGQNTPIGIEPQSLNSEMWYPTGPNNQLKQWVAHGFLEPGYPKDIASLVNWRDATADLELRVRSYLDMNCAHCHDEGRSCSYRSIRLAFDRTADPTNMGVCVVPEEPMVPYTHLIARGNVGRSAIHHRMTTNEESIRMPLIGRSVVDEEAAALLASWIESLGPPCQ